MMCVLVTPKFFARVSSRNTTTKKSKASSVQPRNPARRACVLPLRCCMKGDCTIRENGHRRTAGKPGLVQATRGSYLPHHGEKDGNARRGKRNLEVVAVL